MMIATSFMPNPVPTPYFSDIPLNNIPAPASFSPIVAAKTAPKRKRVSFFPQAQVEYTINREDYTATERSNTWLTMGELKGIKLSCRKFAVHYSKNNISNQDSLRGLEGRTPEGLMRRKQIKSRARHAVFGEQYRQMQYGILDENLLADAYYECTEYAQVEAHMVGLRDQNAAVLADQETFSSPSPYNMACDRGFQRKSMILCAAGAQKRSSSISLATLPARRLLTDAFFKV